MTRMLHFLGTMIGAALASLSVSVAATQVSLLPDQQLRSRVLLDHAPASGWIVQQYESYVELKFSGTELEIVPSSDLLDRMEGFLSDASSEARNGATYLRLTFGCDCVPAVAVNGQGQVTIDIVDVPPVSSAPAIAVSLGSPAPMVAPLAPVKAVTAGGPPATERGGVNVDEARERLITQLLRAADAGLVELQPGAEALRSTQTDAAPESVTSTEPKSEAASADMPSEEELIDRVSAAAAAGDDILASISAPAQQVRRSKREVSAAENQIDQDAVKAAGTDRSSDLKSADGETTDQSSEDLADAARKHSTIKSAEPACFGNDVFDFSKQPPHDLLGDQISSHRRALIGEFDRADGERALDLAKLYVFVGFTVEARQVLENFAADHELAAVFYELSRLRDGDPLPADAAILKSDCVGEQALWRAYAAALAGDGPGAVQAEMAAGRALERLPVAMREDIAAWIGDAAAASGDWDSARRMQSIVSRAATTMPKMSGRGHLLSAKLAFWNNQTETAVEHLRSATASDPKSAAEALFALGDLALRDPTWERSRTQKLRDDLGAMARFMGDSEDGKRAFELEVKLANRAQSQSESMTLLSHGVDTGLVEADRQYELLTEVITDPAAEPNEDPVALHYLEDPAKFAPALAQSGFRTELARSMIELAVPRLAVDVLADEDYEDQELTLMLAEALVDAGEAREAMDVISKLPDSSDKSRLLAATLRSNGEPAEAVSHLDQVLPQTTETEAEIDLLKAKSEAAQEAGDLASALDALEEIFALSPTNERAQEIAMLALAAGRNDLPDDVRAYLAQNSPSTLTGLEPLFGTATKPSDLETPEAVNGYLERLDAEETAIKELLNNG